MKPQLWINLGLPAALLLIGLVSAVAVNYLQPRTDWVLAAFPASTKHPFTAALPYADAVVADNKSLNGVIAYVPDPKKRTALAQQATLIDPLGAALCAPR
jgi:hypothetical protein